MIVFFHGFASAGKGVKSDMLKRAFGEDNVVAPDLPVDPLDVMELVRDIMHNIPKDDKVVFVGTSLGGFYANLCAQAFDCPCVIANPSTRPSKTMAARIGQNTNLATGATFDVTNDHVVTFGQMEREIEKQSNGALISLFLAADDAVLDHRLALEDIPHRRMTYITPDGGHRYELHWNKVIDEVRHILA
jgi:predicted esterase YcpF (UPF0227 family)